MKKPDEPQVGPALRLIRTARGLRQDEAARRSRMTWSHLCRVELGEYRLDSDALLLICAVYGCTVADVERIAADPAGALGLGPGAPREKS